MLFACFRLPYLPTLLSLSRETVWLTQPPMGVVFSKALAVRLYSSSPPPCAGDVVVALQKLSAGLL